MPKILLRSGIAGLVSLSLLLFCSEKNNSTSLTDSTLSGFGKAIVQLPDLSTGALVKIAPIVDSNALTLLIIAPDMDTMKYSWGVATLKGQTVQIDGIPSGANRCFEGFLTNKSGIITHTGKVFVTIIAGQDVPVYLKLSGVGGADVCIEIEGYPTSCGTHDSLYLNTCLRGSTPSDTLGGNIKLTATEGIAYGQITLSDSKGKNLYVFSKPLQKLNAGTRVSYQTTVKNVVTMKNQLLQMEIINSSEISHGILFADSTISSSVIAKFYSVPCYDPVNQLTINSCLNGYTPYDTLKGNINLKVNGTSTEGQVTLVTSKEKNTYIFNSPVVIANSGTQKFCQTTVIDVATKRTHFLNMTVNQYSEITYSYLARDSSMPSDAIAKFFSTPCNDTIVDTSSFFFKFEGRGTGTDTSRFASYFNLTKYNDSASGTFCSTFKLLADTLFVKGIIYTSPDGSGALSMTSTISDTESYRFIVKYTPTFYDGYIYHVLNTKSTTIALFTSR